MASQKGKFGDDGRCGSVGGLPVATGETVDQVNITDRSSQNNSQGDIVDGFYGWRQLHVDPHCCSIYQLYHPCSLHS